MKTNFVRLVLFLFTILITGLARPAHAMLHPGLGRFIQDEPQGAQYVDSLSLYCAYHQNAIAFADPSGFFSVLPPPPVIEVPLPPLPPAGPEGFGPIQGFPISEPAGDIGTWWNSASAAESAGTEAAYVSEVPLIGPEATLILGSAGMVTASAGIGVGAGIAIDNYVIFPAIDNAAGAIINGSNTAATTDELRQFYQHARNRREKEKEDVKCPKDECQDHHIMTDKNPPPGSSGPGSSAAGGPWTKRFEVALKSIGLNLYDLNENICEVCNTGDDRIHSGPHTQGNYHGQIMERLNAILRNTGWDIKQKQLAVRLMLLNTCSELNEPANDLRNLVTKPKE